MEEIFDLTADQMGILLGRANIRIRRSLVIQAGITRLAFASTQSKEGQRAFENFIQEIKGNEERVEVVKDLSKLGMEMR